MKKVDFYTILDNLYPPDKTDYMRWRETPTMSRKEHTAKTNQMWDEVEAYQLSKSGMEMCSKFYHKDPFFKNFELHNFLDLELSRLKNREHSLKSRDRVLAFMLNIEEAEVKTFTETQKENIYNMPSSNIGNWRMHLSKTFGTVAEIRAEYKRRAHKLHPDKGGTTEAMQELNEWRNSQLAKLCAS